MVDRNHALHDECNQSSSLLDFVGALVTGLPKQNMATGEANELFYQDFKHVINYLKTQKQLMDAHMVDFFTSNHWETLLPRNIREDLELLPQLLLTSLPNACTESEDFERFGENLKRFLKEARLAQLKSFSWVKDQKEFTSESRVDFISHIMTPKKSYEVDVMSDAINRLVKQFQVSKVNIHFSGPRVSYLASAELLVKYVLCLLLLAKQMGLFPSVLSFTV